MFNDKPKEEGGGSGIRLPKPEIETKYGTFGLGRVQGKPGITFKKTFAKGGLTGYRKAADGCAKRGKTRVKQSNIAHCASS